MYLINNIKSKIGNIFAKLKFEKINLANARFYLEAMLLQKQLLNSISILKDVKKIDERGAEKVLKGMIAQCIVFESGPGRYKA